MGRIELRLPCPQNVNGIAADPQPDWSFDILLSELNSIDKELNLTVDSPSPFTKTEPRESKTSKDKRGFVMHVSDNDTDYADSDNDLEADSSLVLSGRRFGCDDLYLSDDSEDDITLGEQWPQLMERAGLAEGAVHELTQEHRLSVMEEVRSKITSLETDLVDENEKCDSFKTKIDKRRESQQEKERIFDLQYQREIAEALDSHLTAVQRDHEHMSQLEQRKIRDDMAREEAKRREKAMQEEKARQERIKAEEEARLKLEAARAKAAAIEAEKKAAEEAAAKRASEALTAAQNEAKASKEALRPSNSTMDVNREIKSSVRNVVKASEDALELEKRRRKIYEELSANNNALTDSGNQAYRKYGQYIGRIIKTISATAENIRARAEELGTSINSPQVPQSISIKLFAEKIISHCTNQKSSKAIFAVSRVIVLVTSKSPLAMEILIAELNRVCIYTVPKHISYSEQVFKSRGDYFKALGYKEENGKIEGIDDYMERLSCYMKLYGALVQTEIGSFQNLHGLPEGWAWLERFLTTLPANIFTATALDSFLEMAGYGLYCRYRNQFEKAVGMIAGQFLNALQEDGAASRSVKLGKVKMSIRNYIESKQYMKEPEGLKLRSHLESNDFY